jgi:UDP-N-acetylglucosamine diphosphorylase / glucose-1-phosphate thymidylyltransferase / UDP-N-acetylgalactosamine diphosphorylase / glucosamine-1-phosphate N-acetyltransferase / galactosamine-1-phosphate N-acetyltransferase
MRAAQLFVWPESLAAFAPFFPLDAQPWQWLPQIAAALDAVDWSAAQLPADIPPGVHISGRVHIGAGVRLPPYAVIQGPAWIGPDCEIRPGAFIRGLVITGARCILGNACEYKNCLLLDQVETPHYNYVGDSILGNRAHLGAGAICANLKLARDEVIVHLPDGRHPTGLRKLGTIMGDGAEAGCNSVLQPGSILGRRAAVISMPFHGFLPDDTLAVPRTQISRLPRPK